MLQAGGWDPVLLLPHCVSMGLSPDPHELSFPPGGPAGAGALGKGARPKACSQEREGLSPGSVGLWGRLDWTCPPTGWAARNQAFSVSIRAWD